MRLADISYDPVSGTFSALGKVFAGSMTGGNVPSGEYPAIRIDGKTVYLHRLAFFCMTGEWPLAQVDHINGDKKDARWINLRLATAAQNKANESLRSTNTSGLKGVSWHKGKWRAYVGADHLGLFECPAAAHLAYLVEAKKRYGEFARA